MFILRDILPPLQQEFSDTALGRVRRRWFAHVILFHILSRLRSNIIIYAEQIYYLALTSYLNSATDSRWTFKQARYALLNACRQLYGDAAARDVGVLHLWGLALTYR